MNRELITLPTQEDFLRTKIAEREVLLSEIVEKGKKEVYAKKLRDID